MWEDDHPTKQNQQVTAPYLFFLMSVMQYVNSMINLLWNESLVISGILKYDGHAVI